jgi:hypothetical protein
MAIDEAAEAVSPENLGLLGFADLATLRHMHLAFRSSFESHARRTEF